MSAFLLALGPIIAKFFPSLQSYLDLKSAQVLATEKAQLAQIEANKQIAIAAGQSEAQLSQVKLASTTQEFKQFTFYFLLLPLLFSILFPSKAQEMWHNFDIIPEWFKNLFAAVYLTIWGIPIASSYIGGIFTGITRSVGAVVENRQQYQLEKAKINREAVFAELRRSLFANGLTQQQVNVIDDALDKGEK